MAELKDRAKRFFWRNAESTGHGAALVPFHKMDKIIKELASGYKAKALIKDQQSRIQELEEREKVLIDALETAKSGYELFAYRYPDPDLSHEEYRVKVCTTSEEAIEDINEALESIKG